MLSEEQEKDLKHALVNQIASNISFSEVIDIITKLSVNEVVEQLEAMSEEEKLQTYNEVFAEKV